jgi:NTP pyrophosphatase (non-canonical NTP hydrolase)
MEQELLEIIKHYGLKKQLKKLSEEVYELQEAILLDEGGEESFQHICEERADVEVLLRQLDSYLDIKFEDFSMWMVKKVNRTLERIDDE